MSEFCWPLRMPCELNRHSHLDAFDLVLDNHPSSILFNPKTELSKWSSHQLPRKLSIYWCLHVVVYNFLCISYIYIHPFGFLKPYICCISGISLAKGDDLWTNLRPAMGISRGPGKISRLAIRNGQNPSENMDNNDNKPQMPMKIWRFAGKTIWQNGGVCKRPRFRKPLGKYPGWMQTWDPPFHH